MTIHQKLLEFANGVALPYILELKVFQSYKEEFHILLVGSAATGLCSEKSDVDICILCNEKILQEISIQNKWEQGKPSAIIIDDIQLHYYATSPKRINDKLNELDESVFYLYNTSILLYEGTDEYIKLKDLLKQYSNSTDRFESILNRLKARRRALQSVIEDSEDPILRMKMGLEIIELLLCVTAQYDEVAYDRRKRLYQTTLIGEMGHVVKDEIDKLIYLISKLSNCADTNSSTAFESIVDHCISQIS